ncbi:MAG: InlB B-repeat-containing protein [Clostridiales bacterium]|nr:InlB B-repeat-containing protein [Clostridiales bacterium]
MKKTNAILSTILLVLTLGLLNACNIDGGTTGSSKENQPDNFENQPEYFTEKLTMHNYMHYLTVDCEYDIVDEGYFGGVPHFSRVWYSIFIRPSENGLIFEDCTITIDGSTKDIESKGDTYISLVTIHNKLDGTIDEWSKVSAISGTVKRKNDNTYRIYYHDKDGDVIASDRVTIGKSIEQNKMPDQLVGYTFLGWSTTGFERDIINYPYLPTKDTCLRPVYKGNDIRITLDDGGKISYAIVEYGTIIKLPVPQKENYEFAGWYDSPSGKTVKYTNANGTGIFQWQSLSSQTLYARWLVKKSDKIWDDEYYYSLEYYNIKNAKVSYYKANYFFIDAEPYVTYKINTSTQYMRMSAYVSIRIAGSMGALLEGGQFVNYSFGTDLSSCPTFEFQVSQTGRYFIAVVGYGLQSTPNLDYVYNISCQVSY